MHRLLTWEPLPSGVSKKRLGLALDPGGGAKLVGVIGHDAVGRWHWRAHTAGMTGEGGAPDEREVRQQLCAWLHGHLPDDLPAGVLAQLRAELASLAGAVVVDRRCWLVRLKVAGRSLAYVWPSSPAVRRRGVPCGGRDSAWVLTGDAARALLAELEGRGTSGSAYSLEAVDAIEEAERSQRIEALQRERRDLAVRIDAATQRVAEIDAEVAMLRTSSRGVGDGGWVGGASAYAAIH